MSIRLGQLVFANSFITFRDNPDSDSNNPANKTWHNGPRQTHAAVPLENATPLNGDYLLGKLAVSWPTSRPARRLKATLPRIYNVVLTGDVGEDAQAILAFGLADAFIDFLPHTMVAELSHIRGAMQAAEGLLEGAPNLYY
ncbi:hypothetical protein F4779DRAFT_614698 [Xylariaceae sp. FL0662B]|nr:hypothetical protein F4779DRAFT_614698 [Xylariaceae sp. FL0662B]